MTPKFSLFVFLFSLILLTSCSDDSDSKVEAPATYSFLRDGNSTVSFSGQTTRIAMAEELISALKDFDTQASELLAMFRNADENGENVDPFSTTELNESTKSIRLKVAASSDFFSANSTESAKIRTDFEDWIRAQVSEVFPNENILAEPGIAGQIADGTSVRYVNGKGLEYNQAVAKSLIGALMADQILNNYLSPSILDEANNRSDNDAGTVSDGNSYTIMEHKWDEAFGYLFGASSNPENPIADIGADDSFLNKYVGRVEEDEDFAGITQEIFDAFKLGRAAIVAKDYEVRDQQADIIKDKISEVIAIRAVYYLQQGKNALPVDGNQSAYGPAFHDLSEGFGFVYSLRFTRKSGSDDTYFTRSEVDGFINDMMANNGFWDIQSQTLDNISQTIADKFDFTLAQAAE